jgi:hypothetical protein
MLVGAARVCRWIGAILLVLVAAPAPGWADTIYIDNTFNPANYQIIEFRSDPGINFVIQQIAGPAMQVLTTFPTGEGDSQVGFIEPTFTYNPLTQGAAADVSITASKYTAFIPSLPITANVWRPLIFQAGKYYEAQFNLPLDTAVYLFADAVNLGSADFQQFDFTTGTFDPSAHPDFNGSLMEFGFAERAFISGGAPGTIADERFDPLTVDISTVPEPASMTLTALGLTVIARYRRRRSRIAS